MNVLKLMGLKAGKWHTFVVNSTTRGCDTERKKAGVRQEGRRLFGRMGSAFASTTKVSISTPRGTERTCTCVCGSFTFAS